MMLLFKVLKQKKKEKKINWEEANWVDVWESHIEFVSPLFRSLPLRNVESARKEINTRQPVWSS